MKRVVILQEYVPHYRAAFFSILKESAARAGIEVVVASGRPRRAQKLRGDSTDLGFLTPIMQLEWRVFGRRLVFRRIRQIISGADIVILEQARRNLDAYRLLGRRHSAQLVALWGHGRDYTQDSTRVDRAIQRWLTLRADWFFAYTSGGAAALVADGFRPGRIIVVQNSIDTERLRFDVETVSKISLENFCTEHGLSGSTAIFVGALDESKRLSFLIQACKIAAQLHPTFRLLIAGDGPMRDEVETWARQFTWIRYLGAVKGPEKACAMAASQILAMPGRVGLVAVDSFAARLPIVTTVWQWHAPEFEYLADGVTSVIADNTVEGFAKAMCETLHDPAALSRLGEGCALAGDLITVDKMASNFLAGIQDALSAGRLVD